METTDCGVWRTRLGVLALWLAMPSACGGRADLIDAPIPLVDVPIDTIDAAPPGSLAPRLIAPLSMTSVTQQRPLLRWEIPDSVVDPVVELCEDRGCTARLAIVAEMALDGLSAAPRASLPHGWVYWRVRATWRGQAVSSATWQFWVGPSSASNPVDTGNGAMLDVNGDGHVDFLVGGTEMFENRDTAYLYLGSATASAVVWNGIAPARITLSPVGFGAFGKALASAGDVDGDGYADFLISGAGAVHLYLGSAQPSAQDWNGTGARRRDLMPGVGGLGVFVAGAGDVDGDGYADFIAGTYVYFGGAGGTIRRIDLASPTTSDGFGAAVAGVGDVNGDGYAELLVGASSDNFDPGRAYLYLGSPAPRGTSWNPPAADRRIELITPDGFNRGFARTLARAGDINGDGYADFLIASQFADGPDGSRIGAAHVYFGSALPGAAGWNGASASLRVDLVSPDGGDTTFGSAVAGAGDVNADGFADFVIGNSQVGQGRGAAHLYLGGATVDLPGWNGALTHASRVDLFSPDGPGARFGSSAGNVGDVNGDGFSDFLVGTSSFVSTNTGAAHLYLGLSNPDIVSWNGLAPAMRVDLTNPSQLSSGFGNAVALASRPGDSLLSRLSDRSSSACHHRSGTLSCCRG